MDQLEQLRKSFEILQASAPDPESIADEIASADEELQAKEKELQALKEELDEKVRYREGVGEGLGMWVCWAEGAGKRGRGCRRWNSLNEQLDAGVEGDRWHRQSEGPATGFGGWGLGGGNTAAAAAAQRRHGSCT